MPLCCVALRLVALLNIALRTIQVFLTTLARIPNRIRKVVRAHLLKGCDCGKPHLHELSNVIYNIPIPMC